MFRRTRPALTLLTALVVGAAATGCGGDDGGDDGTAGISVGYIADYNGGALLAIADEQGLWEKAGLDPDYKTFTNGPLTIQALGAGDLDFGYIGSGAMWIPATGKAELLAINSVSLADRLIAQPGIDSVEDLKGKKVGVPEGTSGDLLLRMALEEAGMTKDDVDVVPMDPTTAVSAFSSNQIDAAGLWYPLVDTIKKQVPDFVELAGNEDFFPERTFPSAFVAQEGLAEKDPKLAKAFISVIKQANDYRHANPEKTVQLAAEFLEAEPEDVAAQADVAKLYTTDELVAATKDGTIDGWLSGLQELFIDVGTMDEVADPGTFYSSKAYIEAAGE